MEKESRERPGEVEQRSAAPELGPPETPAEAAERRLAELDESIPQYKASSEKTTEELDNAIQELNAEPPRVDISKETVTQETLGGMRQEKQQIQEQLGGEKRPGVDPEAGLTQKSPEDAPVAVEASREQMESVISDKMKESMGELATEVKAARATAENGELTPEQIAKLPSFDKIREVFKGSEEVGGTEVENGIEKMAEQMAQNLKEKGSDTDIRPDEIEEMGLENFSEQIQAAAAENVQRIEKTPFEKEQAEKEAKKRTADARPATGRHTQRTEEEGLRPSA